MPWKAPPAYDVILSKAVFQWVPGHETLFPALVANLAEGGRLAIQSCRTRWTSSRTA